MGYVDSKEADVRPQHTVIHDPPQTNFDSVHLTYFDDNIIGLQNDFNEQVWRPAFLQQKMEKHPLRQTFQISV